MPEKQGRGISFFLHHYENRLNGRIRRFLLWERLDRYDPERFWDYKIGRVLAMLDCLREYNPAQGVDFLTYAHHFMCHPGIGILVTAIHSVAYL